MLAELINDSRDFSFRGAFVSCLFVSKAELVLCKLFHFTLNSVHIESFLLLLTRRKHEKQTKAC